MVGSRLIDREFRKLRDEVIALREAKADLHTRIDTLESQLNAKGPGRCKKHANEPGPSLYHDCCESARLRELCKGLESQLAERDARISELKALVGTVRDIAGCEVRNVDDIGVEQHSREIGARFATLEPQLATQAAALESAEAVAKRHDWQPGAGQCICDAHVAYRAARTQPEKPQPKE